MSLGQMISKVFLFDAVTVERNSKIFKQNLIPETILHFLKTHNLSIPELKGQFTHHISTFLDFSDTPTH